MELKLGRHIYVITNNDMFMDNTACIQLLTQSKETGIGSGRPHPVLSQRAIKELAGFKKTNHEHNYGSRVTMFSIKTKILE
jgi:hypothetical protein